MTARLAAIFVAAASILNAETGYDAWLRYPPLDDKTKALYSLLPNDIVVTESSPVIASARDELVRAISGLLGKIPRTENALPAGSAIVLGTLTGLRQGPLSQVPLPSDLLPDGYLVQTQTVDGRVLFIVTGSTDRGVLYGAFALAKRLALRQPISQFTERSNPYAPIRWVNQWDNLDGSIERGYAGRSIFFADNNVVPDLTRARDYARLLASIGINGCTVNNVNANPRVLTTEFLPQLARIADAFRPWGVRLSISVDLGSPKIIGGLKTFDPLDPSVAKWWQAKADEIYRAIPDFAGFVLKADSEGRVGPSTYGRTHADAANVLARALKPHGGVVVYRGFVYNHHLDWTNLKNDRARAAYDNFHPLDGQFDDNAAVQIKYGPIDFQVREPVSPLIGALPHTNETLELQITQEYTGQQRHLCYLLPMWKTVLNFDFHLTENHTPVKDIVSGKTFNRPLGGFVGVANVGMDQNWLGNDLAMANLYGFGRIAWNPDTTERQVTRDWIRLTFGYDPLLVDSVASLLESSWSTYENYTGPLGLGTLTDILHGHYGPNIESAERNGWGQWIRADSQGVGMDRTIATGTGFIGQYPPAVATLFESLETCPDSLLLFMHHVAYTYQLHSKKTVIQHIYDSHYQGAETAGRYPEWWKAIKGRIDDERYNAVLAKLEYQAGHAVVWRDAICSWFLRESGIPDAQGRAGHFPNRTEAESMNLTGFKSIEVKPWEDASGGKAVVCNQSSPCQASFKYAGEPGEFNIAVQYFDTNNGIAQFKLYRGEQLLSSWPAADNLPATAPNGDSSTRHKVTGVTLQTGDSIRIEGVPDGGDRAAFDYVEIEPTRESSHLP